MKKEGRKRNGTRKWEGRDRKWTEGTERGKDRQSNVKEKKGGREKKGRRWRQDRKNKIYPSRVM